MRLHNLKHRIVAILLALAIFNFNLVILPAQAEGCTCDHPHGDGELACYCGVNQKPSCHSSGPSISKRKCGLEHKSDEFYVPADDHPTIISSEHTDLNLFASILVEAGCCTISGVDLPPIEHPPSIL